jgi:hypothetical protein
MDWNAIKQWLEGGTGCFNIWPWWVGLIVCIAIIGLAALLIWAIYDASKSSRKQKIEDSRNWAIITERGYKKDVIEDFLEIYNVRLKHIVKYKMIENELKNFSTGKLVSLPGKTEQRDDGSGSAAAAGLAAGMIIGSGMGGHH